MPILVPLPPTAGVGAPLREEVIPLAVLRVPLLREEVIPLAGMVGAPLRETDLERRAFGETTPPAGALRMEVAPLKGVDLGEATLLAHLAPPLKEEVIPLAVLRVPPLREEVIPLAVLRVPPLKEEVIPLAGMEVAPLKETDLERRAFGETTPPAGVLRMEVVPLKGVDLGEATLLAHLAPPLKEEVIPLAGMVGAPLRETDLERRAFGETTPPAGALRMVGAPLKEEAIPPVGILWMASEAGRVHEGDTPTRLQKYLADMGLASRREVENWIAAGALFVDGEQAVLGTKVTPQSTIRLHGKPLVKKAPYTTEILCYHKPIGEITSRDKGGFARVFDRVPPPKQGKMDCDWALGCEFLGTLAFDKRW